MSSYRYRFPLSDLHPILSQLNEASLNLGCWTARGDPGVIQNVYFTVALFNDLGGVRAAIWGRNAGRCILAETSWHSCYNEIERLMRKIRDTGTLRTGQTRLAKAIRTVGERLLEARARGRHYEGVAQRAHNLADRLEQSLKQSEAERSSLADKLIKAQVQHSNTLQVLEQVVDSRVRDADIWALRLEALKTEIARMKAEQALRHGDDSVRITRATNTRPWES